MMQIKWKRRTALWLTTLCCTLSMAMGQVVLKGRVLDATSKEPLPQSNVRLINAEGKMQAGRSTDGRGAFALPSVPEGRYKLVISYVGYKTYEETLNLKKGTQTLRDVLLAESTTLGEVSVVAKATEVVVKGDTIEYNAGSFATSEGDAVLELIKKLPGAEVDDKGNVKVNGKDISQIMVDGKRFFANDPKVALKNLPAELVDKVQVLSRETDNARMTGFSDGDDETVINLSIKPGRKQGLFGSAYVGVGTNNRYEANAIVNRISGQKQWTVLGGSNNTNNAGFSDISSELGSSGLAQMAAGNMRRGFGRGFGGNNGIATSHTLGANIVLSPSLKLQAGGNAFLGNNSRESISKSQTTHIRTGGNTTDASNTESINKGWTAGSQIRLEWKPSERTEIVVTPQLSYGTGHNLYTSHAISSYEATGAGISTNTLKQTSDNKNYEARLEVFMSRKFGDRGRTLALTLDGRLGGNESLGEYLSNTFVNATNTHRDRSQEQRNDQTRQQFRVQASYVEPLSKSLAMLLSYQLQGRFSQAERYVFDLDPSTNAYTLKNTNSSYELDSRFLAHRAGLSLRHFSKTINVVAGLNVNPSDLKTVRQYSNREKVIEQSVVNYSPTLRFRYKPNAAFTLNINYRGQSNEPTAQQLAPVNDNTNPLLQYIGNENLKPSFSHNLFASISLFEAKKQRTLNIYWGTTLTENNIISNSLYNSQTGVRTIGYENVNGDWTTMIGGFFTTPIWGKALSLRLSSRNSINHSVGFSDGQRNLSKGLNLNEEIGLNYRKGVVDTNLKFVWGYHSVRNSIAHLNSPTTQDYGVHWDSYVRLPMGLNFEAQLRHTSTRGYAEGYNFPQTLVNLGVSYSFLKGKAATVRLKVYDLLAEQRSVFRSVTALSVSSTETNILGRYAMLHFIYKFSSFSGNASRADMQSPRGRGYGRSPHNSF